VAISGNQCISYLFGGHVGHHDDVRNVLFARQLPSLDEALIGRPLEDNRRAQIIQLARDALGRERIA
jgi:hypothetical protein